MHDIDKDLCKKMSDNADIWSTFCKHKAGDIWPPAEQFRHRTGNCTSLTLDPATFNADIHNQQKLMQNNTEDERTSKNIRKPATKKNGKENQSVVPTWNSQQKWRVLPHNKYFSQTIYNFY